MKIEILLSTWNGEKYLSEQLDSLFNQTFQNYHITIWDDQSTDSTRKIIFKYLCNHPDKITYISEERKLGYPDCFWYLLEKTQPADMYAFCDQDDVWCDKKLACCEERCKDMDQTKPILYVHDYNICDEKLKIYGEHHIANDGFDPNYPYNLIYYVMTSGFTMILNESLRKRILQNELQGKNIFHDRWIFWCGYFSGLIIYDPRLLVNYRRHEATVTQTGKGNFALLKEWWAEDISGNRITDYSKTAQFFADCYSFEIEKKEKIINNCG